MQTLEKMTIGEYVAKDFRTAAVFSKYGIDFCSINKFGWYVKQVSNKAEK